MLSAANTARIPAGLAATVTAALPIAGTTAADVLDQLGLPAGATILVNGVGGGVGPQGNWPPCTGACCSTWAGWRKRLFIETSCITSDAAEYFGLPPRSHGRHGLPHRRVKPGQRQR